MKIFKKKGNSSRKKIKNLQTNPEKKKTILAGWMHYNHATEKYVTVRVNKGGGIRNIDFSLDAGRFDILASLKAVFFPQGENCHGHLSTMHVSLGDFTGKVISGNQFSLEHYIKEHKLSKVRLYILTKEYETIKEEEDSDDSLDLCFDFDHEPQTSKNINKDKEDAERPPIEPVVTDPLPSTSSLIGSTEQRKQLKEEQTDQYEESLLIDQAKSRRKDLKEARAVAIFMLTTVPQLCMTGLAL